MKYIRTKDRILDTKNLIKVEYEDGRFKNIYRNTRYFLYKAIKEADTIAELIDAYVFVSKSGETHYIYFKLYDMGVCLGSRIENDEKFKNHLLENGNVYGAIWTDKGLIYVAKMNDEGNLKLI